MDIPQKFQEFLEDTGLSMEMLRYGVRLLKVNDELNEHREQCERTNELQHFYVLNDFW